MSQPPGLSGSLSTPLVLNRKDRLLGLRPDMKTRNLFVLVLSSLIVGIGSGWMLLGERPPFGAVHLGPWQSFPRMGSSDVDPYGRAILARGPHLPLAAGEGIQLVAQSDSTAAALDARCSYRIIGSTLPSRGWTMTVADTANRALSGPQAAALSDADVVTDETGQLVITASTMIAAGTWLRLPADRGFNLILRFYDTPSSAAIAQLPSSSLPRIERLSCRNSG
ncbi:MAG: DUF1214 domain-containing protein [Bosea sp. (in: a-proteobacteria)]